VRRFFVEAGLLGQGSGVISGETGRHIAAVLRLKAGESILLADGKGQEAVAVITALEKDGVHVGITAHSCHAPEAKSVRITIYQGLPKGDKLDLILQKCTELGVDRIVPFGAERSVVRLADERRDKRVQRWEKIVLEAARQSGRSRIPTIGFAEDLQAALQGDGSDLGLLLWEDEQERGLRQVLAQNGQAASVAVIIGPEGGLTRAEVAAAAAAGFLPVTLGRRILRTETAGPAVLAILQYVLGDMG
jgi:16S rRNA (uracil1498-N3)-methyltransferase